MFHVVYAGCHALAKTKNTLINLVPKIMLQNFLGGVKTVGKRWPLPFRLNIVLLMINTTKQSDSYIDYFTKVQNQTKDQKY